MTSMIHSQLLTSVNSPQISAVRDSALASPDTQIGQNQLPISLKSHTQQTRFTRWGAFRSQRDKRTIVYV